jgi:hypothetical protein
MQLDLELKEKINTPSTSRQHCRPNQRKQPLTNTEGALKKGQSRETGNIGHTRQRKTKQQDEL